jgi:hypothetical protein
MPGNSQKMLTQHLRELKHDNLIAAEAGAILIHHGFTPRAIMIATASSGAAPVSMGRLRIGLNLAARGVSWITAPDRKMCLGNGV